MRLVRKGTGGGVFIWMVWEGFSIVQYVSVAGRRIGQQDLYIQFLESFRRKMCYRAYSIRVLVT
jgi:hypothetical protein